LRRYNKAVVKKRVAGAALEVHGEGQGLTLVPISAQLEVLCPPYDPA
jgi:hypothetical protein